MSRKPSIGITVCPNCGRKVQVTSKRNYIAHWWAVGRRCPESGKPVTTKVEER